MKGLTLQGVTEIVTGRLPTALLQHTALQVEDGWAWTPVHCVQAGEAHTALARRADRSIQAADAAHHACRHLVHPSGQQGTAAVLVQLCVLFWQVTAGRGPAPQEAGSGDCERTLVMHHPLISQ